VKTWACDLWNDLWKLSIVDVSDLLISVKPQLLLGILQKLKMSTLFAGSVCLSVCCAMVSASEWTNFFSFLFFFIGDFHGQMWGNSDFHAYSPLVQFTLLVGVWAGLNVYNKELVQNGEI
jgi:hypothetical protein